MALRIIFMGTPQFAVPTLYQIVKDGHTVCGVVTQPDRAAGRSKKPVFSPVKEAALALGLPVFQFEKIRTEGVDVLKSLQADIMITAAYGQILSQQILDMTRFGVINAHASILPKYRGSSPVQWAIRNGETTLGVTVMQTAKRVDSGDIILIKTLALNGQENSAEALEKLSEVAKDAIHEALTQLENGTATFQKQDEAQATHCAMIKKEDGILSFLQPAEAVVSFVLGMNPWPSAFCDTPFGRLKILRAAVDGDAASYPPHPAGYVVKSDKHGVSIACQTGAVALLEVQGEGGKAMPASVFFRGHPVKVGDRLV